MAISILDRLKGVQKVNPTGTGTVPASTKRTYIPLSMSQISFSSRLGLTGLPNKYVGKPSAFVE